jgi:ribosomal protein S2
MMEKCILLQTTVQRGKKRRSRYFMSRYYIFQEKKKNQIEAFENMSETQKRGMRFVGAIHQGQVAKLSEHKSS